MVAYLKAKFVASSGTACGSCTSASASLMRCCVDVNLRSAEISTS